MRSFLSSLLALVTSPKMQLVLRTSWTIMPLMPLIEKYFFKDWEFLGFLLVLILVDTVMGVQRGWVTRSVSSRGFSRVFVKLAIYANLLILTHVMVNFTVRGEPNVLFKWFDYFIYSCMMAREALSILEHIALIEPRLVPKALLKRLALISEEGIEAAMTALPITQLSTAAPEPPVAADPAADFTGFGFPGHRNPPPPPKPVTPEFSI